MAFVSSAIKSVVGAVSDVVSGGPPSAPAPVAPPTLEAIATNPAPDTTLPAPVVAKQDTSNQATQASLNRGRSSTILTGGAGLSDLGSTSKVLLGQ